MRMASKMGVGLSATVPVFLIPNSTATNRSPAGMELSGPIAAGSMTLPRVTSSEWNDWVAPTPGVAAVVVVDGDVVDVVAVVADLAEHPARASATTDRAM